MSGTVFLEMELAHLKNIYIYRRYDNKINIVDICVTAIVIEYQAKEQNVLTRACLLDRIRQ